jgi:hypothetical protein
MLRRATKLLTVTYNSMSRCCFRKDESPGDEAGTGIPRTMLAYGSCGAVRSKVAGALRPICVALRKKVGF